MANFLAFYPPSGGGGSNASVGANGDVAPTFSTEVGGINPSGDLQPLQTDASGFLLVSLAADPIDPLGVNLTKVGGTNITLGQKASAASLPVVVSSDQSAIHTIVDSSALPGGAATAALQTSGNASLTSIDTKTPALGQALAAASVPVVLTAAQISTLTPLTSVTVTQATGTNLHTTVDNFPATQPVSGTVAATQSGTWSTRTQDGSGNAISSTSGALNVVVPDATATGSITTVNLNPNSGTATAGSTVAVTTLNGQISWTAQVTGTYTGALTPQVTVDGTNWIALSATAITNINTNAQAATITSAAVGIFEISAPPCAQLRITALGAMTGTAVVTLRVSAATGRVGLDSPIPAGTAIIGALSANQSSNVAQINAVTPLMGNGTTGTGSLRVTIASDTTSNTNPYLIAQAGYTKSNTPTYNVYSSTPVTTGAYTQLVASTTSAVKQLQIFDSSGQGMILATGAAASEVDQIYVPPGGGVFNLAIAASTRVSVKALTASATTGYLLVDYLG